MAVDTEHCAWCYSMVNSIEVAIVARRQGGDIVPLDSDQIELAPA